MNGNMMPMAKEHLSQVAALEALCFSTPWSEHLFAVELEREEAHYWVALDESGQVMGYAGFYAVLEEGYITNVAVHPKSRRQGIADALIGALVQTAKAENLAFLTLEARTSNAPAIGLYAKHGFLPVGQRKNYYTSPREDAILMTLWLTPHSANKKERQWRNA